MLLEFADSKDLVVLNTMFSKEDAKKINFDSGENMSQVDYILMRTADRKLVRDVKVIPGEPCLTQHRLLVCVLSLTEVIPLRKKKVFISWCKIWKLRQPALRNLFQERVKARLVDGEGGDVNEHWIRLRDYLVEAAETVCGRTKGARRRHETRFWG